MSSHELVERRGVAHERTHVWLEAGPGDGAPVVLQHGFPDSPEAWAATAGHLADRGHRVVVPWLRGYHPDTWVPGRGLTARELGEDLAAVMDAAAIDRAVVVGHDWGAAAAYALGNLAPERVRLLVGVAIPHPRALPRDPRLLLDVGRHFLTFQLPFAEWLVRRDDHAMVDRLYARWAPGWTGPVRDAAVARSKAVLADDEALNHALDYYRALRRPLPRELTRRTALPALVVGGADDLGGRPDVFRDSVTAFDPPADVVIIPDAGHWPHLEQPDAFRAALDAALGGLADAS